MRHVLTTFSLLLIAVVTSGCGYQETPTSSTQPALPAKPSSESSEKDLALLRYDTGDVANWPDYHFPLQHSFELLEPPPEVIGPFSAADIPVQE